MSEIIRRLCEAYLYLFDDIADPRTKSYFLVAKPYQALTLLGLYLMFVFKWGPQWMKNKPPFNLRRVLMIYNAVQVLACAFLFIIGINKSRNYRWVCEPVDFSDSDEAVLIAQLVYCYFLLKILDLADTIFYVLRKKFNQISFLHVYHHAGMVALTWGAVTYYPGGHGSYVGLLNSFVHTVMYTYYFLTVAVPAVKQISAWKKHITQLQILQFLLLIIHMSTIVFKSDCGYPRWTAALFLPQNIFILILFVDFYIKTYIKNHTAVIKPRVLQKAKVSTILEEADKRNDGVFETSIRNRKDDWRANDNDIART